MNSNGKYIPKVVVVTEYYPRKQDPVLGIWAHRQAVATKAAGADVRVVVLYRPIPSKADLKSRSLRRILRGFRQPLHTELDGIKVTYVPFIAPSRNRSYASWGRWATPTLAIYLRLLRRSFNFDLIHAHYAAPAGDAVLRSRVACPLVVSVHGGDVLHLAEKSQRGRNVVSKALTAADLVLANSSAIAERCRSLGAANATVLHLGTDLPELPLERSPQPLIATLGHLIARKRHSDVIAALALLRESQPQLQYLVVGDGPELQTLQQLTRSLQLEDRVTFTGQLAHDEALRQIRQAQIFVLPSTEEAFGVAYIEAMAAAIPAIGCTGEAGPQEITAAGEGMQLIPAGDIEALAKYINTLLNDPQALKQLGIAARQTVVDNFTWERCGKATLAAYLKLIR